MAATGHSLIKAKLAEIGAPLAGEMSGHIFFADGYYGFDDAVYVAVRLLDILSRARQSLAEMRDRLPSVVNTPELRFACSESRKFEVVARGPRTPAPARRRDDRHRRRAGAHRRRLVAVARLEHPGGPRRPRRIRDRRRASPGSNRNSPPNSPPAGSNCQIPEPFAGAPVVKKERSGPEVGQVAFVSSMRRISTQGGEVRISLKACIQSPVSCDEPTPRLRNWSS